MNESLTEFLRIFLSAFFPYKKFVIPQALAVYELEEGVVVVVGKCDATNS